MGCRSLFSDFIDNICCEAFWEMNKLKNDLKKQGIKLWLAMVPLQIVLLLTKVKSLDGGTRIAWHTYIEIYKCMIKKDPKVGIVIPYHIHGSSRK